MKDRCQLQDKGNAGSQQVNVGRIQKKAQVTMAKPQGSSPHGTCHTDLSTARNIENRENTG